MKKAEAKAASLLLRSIDVPNWARVSELRIGIGPNGEITGVSPVFTDVEKERTQFWSRLDWADSEECARLRKAYGDGKGKL